MARESKIGWTDSTHNFWIGCEETGERCKFCYARRENERRRWVRGWGPNGERRRTKTWGPPGKPLRGAPKNWQKEAPTFLAEHGRKRRVFCNSLSDFFDKKAPEGTREEAWQVIRGTPDLEWQVVTGRFPNVEKMLPSDWSQENYGHIILIVSFVTQAEAERDIPRVAMLRDRYPWLRVAASIEPMLEAIDLGYTFSSGYTRNGGRPVFDWVICGGESGDVHNEARPFNLAWARSLRAQCRVAGVPFFMKQLGNNPIFADNDNEELLTGSGKWDAPEAWPEDLRIQQFPPQRIAA